MHNPQMVFKRLEKKYLITESQYSRIIDAIKDRTTPDVHRQCTVCSLYFDTPDHLLIRRSIDKPVYKEKLRLRSYDIPSDEAQVFAEIKKKYKKIVYKRRASMRFKDAHSFFTTGIIPDGYDDQQQIFNEIAWLLHLYNQLVPSMLIFYRRAAFAGLDHPNLRVTFDTDVLWRDEVFSPSAGIWGNRLLKKGLAIMEIKTPDAIPMWLAELLSSESIYPTSFSKYGTAYQQSILKSPYANRHIQASCNEINTQVMPKL